jgi:hypothetical protein
VVVYGSSGSVPISGVEIHLEWDPSMLEATQVVPGNTFQGYNTYSPLQDVDNGGGKLWYAHSMIESFCVTGDWIVATVTFRTLGYGESPLSFGIETIMACAGISVDPVVVNGQVNIERPTPVPSATPIASHTPTPVDATPTPVPEPTIVCEDVLENGDFEQVNAGWEWVAWGGASDRTPHTGIYSAYLAGYNSSSDAMYQTFEIPSDAESASLSYWWYVETTEAEHPYDFVHVELVHDGGTASLAVYSDGDVLNTWTLAGPFDLMAYAGQTVQLFFRSETDGKNYSSFFVDDVVMDVCAPEIGPITTPTATPTATQTRMPPTTPDPDAPTALIPLVLKGFAPSAAQ